MVPRKSNSTHLHQPWRASRSEFSDSSPATASELAMKLSRRSLASVVLACVFVASAGLLFQKYWLDQAPSSFDPAYPAVNAQGDPILAVYEGRTPCQDCQTAQLVKMQLVLYHNRETATPTTYWLGLVKVGEGNVRWVPSRKLDRAARSCRLSRSDRLRARCQQPCGAPSILACERRYSACAR